MNWVVISENISLGDDCLTERLMVVTSERFVAGVVWSRKNNTYAWRVANCAPILNWMRGKTLIEVLIYLDHKKEQGWTWCWQDSEAPIKRL
jgi:hypothetical protein